MEILTRWILTFVLNALWQLPLVAGAAAIAGWLLKRSAARHHYRLWVLALALNLLLPALSLWRPWSAGSVPGAGASAGARAVRATPATPWGVDPLREIAYAPKPALGTTSDAGGTWHFLRRRTLAFTASRLLAYGIALAYGLLLARQLGRLYLGWRGTRRIRRAASERLLPARVQGIAATFQAKFQIRPVPILASSALGCPVTLGIRHPAIIVPERLLQPAEEADLAAALAHEMAHVRRSDFAVNLLLELVYLPLAFHPVAGWVKRALEEARELACDEMAAKQLADPQTYARSLVNMAKFMAHPAPRVRPDYSLGAFAANILEKRVMKILDEGPPQSVRRTAMALLAGGLLLAATGLAASLLSLHPEEPRGAEASPALDALVGTWVGKCDGKIFVIETLKPEGSRLSGTIAIAHAQGDAAGRCVHVIEEPTSPQSAQAITDVRLDGTRISFKGSKRADGTYNEFEMVLTGDTSGEITFLNAGPGVSPKWAVTRNSENALVGSPGGAVRGGVVGGVGGGVVGGIVGGVPGGVETQARSTSTETEGSIKGTIFDPSGARVPDAAVTIANEQTGDKLETKTNQTGDFSLTELAAGEYSVEVEKPGFAVFLQQKFKLGPRVKGPELSIVLQPGEVIENVEVTALAIPGAAKPEEPHRPQRIRVGGLVQATKLVHMVHPAYPEGARQQGKQGVVLLQAVISMQGEPLSLRVLSSPDPELAQAATDAVRQWRYQPTLLNGEPIEVVTTIAVGFHLVEEPPSSPP